MVTSYKTILSHIRGGSNLRRNSRDIWLLTRSANAWQEFKNESYWCAVLSVSTPPVTNQSISWLDNASAYTTQSQLLLHLHIDGARFTKWLTPFPLNHHQTYPTLTKLQHPSISNPDTTQMIPPFHAILLLYSLFTSLFITFAVLGKIFGSMGAESSAACEISHYGKINILYSSPNIVRVIMSRKMRWAVNMARMG